MKSKLTILLMMLVMTTFWIPATAVDVSAQKGNKHGRLWEGDQGRRWERRRWNRHWRDTHGYRNYGQYRRTQVGNRRFRMERRYSWRDGRRVSIWRRIFY